MTLDDVAWYSVVTLRDQCLEHNLSTLRTHYPQIPAYVVDNNIGLYSIKDTAAKYGAQVLTNQELLSLTVNQTVWSKRLFEKHPLLCFSSDDVIILEGGFIERALEKINQNCHLVSFATDRDPVAYMYDQTFFNELGFNTAIPGKEHTDIDLVNRVRAQWGTMESVGEYWQMNQIGWHSRYVLNPHLGQFNKTDVNVDLRKLNRLY